MSYLNGLYKILSYILVFLIIITGIMVIISFNSVFLTPQDENGGLIKSSKMADIFAETCLSSICFGLITSIVLVIFIVLYFIIKKQSSKEKEYNNESTKKIKPIKKKGKPFFIYLFLSSLVVSILTSSSIISIWSGFFIIALYGSFTSTPAPDAGLALMALLFIILSSSFQAIILLIALKLSKRKKDGKSIKLKYYSIIGILFFSFFISILVGAIIVQPLSQPIDKDSIYYSSRYWFFLNGLVWQTVTPVMNYCSLIFLLTSDSRKYFSFKFRNHH